MTIENEVRPTPAPRAEQLATLGALLGAFAASCCCFLPLVLFSLGVSGAWIGHLTRLAPYQPYILAATLLCLGYGYWRVYRAATCANNNARCAALLSNRPVWVGLTIATILLIASLGLDFLGRLFANF